MNGMLPPHSWAWKLREPSTDLHNRNLVCQVTRHIQVDTPTDGGYFGLILQPTPLWMSWS
jgi:hypothetical protein